MKKLKRRWFKVGTVPIYYNEDGTVATHETIVDLLCLHACADLLEREKLSDYHDVFCKDSDDSSYVEKEVKDEDTEAV